MCIRRKGEVIPAKSRFAFWVFVSILSLPLPLALPAIAKDTEHDALLFHTNHCDWGPMEIYVSKDGIKKTMVKQELVILAVKPNWQPIAFWHKGKQICQIGNHGSVYDKPLMRLPSNVKTHRIETRLKGLSVLKESFYFKPEVLDETDTMVGAFMPSGNASKSRVTVIGQESFRLEDKAFSSGLIEAAGRILDVVPSQGIAIQNRWILRDGDRLGGWTLVDWRHVSVKSSDFALPRNYTRCNSFKGLLDKAVNADLEDLAKQMDFGRPLGK